MSTLILPCAGRSARFPGVRPKWMLTYPDGKLMLQKAIEGIRMTSIGRIIVTLVKEHCEKFDADLVVRQAFGDSVDLCILDNFTSSQSETVALTVKKMSVEGSFVSKDSDGYAGIDINEPGNFLVGADLSKFLHITNVAGKSFLVLNDQNMIIDIIEKRVCSNIINVGVYGFESSAEFLEAYQTLKEAWHSQKGEIYLSHIISFLIGQGRHFSYKETTDYEDWGLLSDWYQTLKRRRTYFIDIDGVIFKNKGKYGRLNWDTKDEPLENNIRTIQKLAKEGAQIILCTARPEQHRGQLEASLQHHGVVYHQMIMGCNHSQRVLINDFADTNPYPSCRAINVTRDSDSLDTYFAQEG